MDKKSGQKTNFFTSPLESNCGLLSACVGVSLTIQNENNKRSQKVGIYSVRL